MKTSWSKYPACFFHEAMLKRISHTLLNQGFPVVVVEQMEPNSIGKGKDEVIRREVCAVFTKGTYVEFEQGKQFSQNN
jgi:DNA mismatch repair ATPase MutS